jgi:hypothetical protein
MRGDEMSKNWDKEAKKQVAELQQKAPDYSDAWADLREAVQSGR